MTVGHSEYWSAGMRTAVTDARNAGTSLAFFAGNLMWWKVRWASSQYGNEPYRTMITYKESLDTARSDPADPSTWTGEWRDPRFSPPADGGQPENALTGQFWFVNEGTYAMQVPSQYSTLRFWRDTSVASLQSGQHRHTVRRVAGLRMGRGRRQRVPASRRDSTCPRPPRPSPSSS